MCGSQVYRLTEPRYLTGGDRGVLFPGGCRVDWFASSMMLLEGFFDFLAVLHWATEEKELRNLVPVCTFGNQLSVDQVADILSQTPEEATVLIGFDADKPGAALAAHQRFVPFRKTLTACPPHPCKDWDEALRHMGEEAADTFRMILQSVKDSGMIY